MQSPPIGASKRLSPHDTDDDGETRANNRETSSRTTVASIRPHGMRSDDARTDQRCNNMHGTIDDRSLRKLNVSSSPLRKFLVNLVIRGKGSKLSVPNLRRQHRIEAPYRWITRGVDYLAAESISRPTKTGGVNYAVAESISRSRFLF